MAVEGSTKEEPTKELLQQQQQPDEVDMTFTKELRKATKDVHKISDVLVNAKFAFALSDDGVWYDGLLAFYEIYKFFETHLPERLLPKELHRTAAFEKDFDFYYGKDWKKTYEPRDSVKKYLAHLEEVYAKNEMLLFAYAFQMYMALMSGGQLLQKKRMIARKLWIGKKDEIENVDNQTVNGESNDLESRPMPLQVTICPEGCAATFFPEKISVLKNKLRTLLNEHYGKFDDEMRAAFIEESRNVFLFNGEVVRSVKGVNRVGLQRIGLGLLIATSLFLAIKFALK